MADNKIGDGLKKILLAGVGAVAITAEKGSEIIGELVKKGELTVEQGKELNKDLQRNFKDSMDKKGINIDEISQKISKMSEEELAKIKEQIEAVEKLIKEKMKKAEEDAEEALDEAADDLEAADEIVEETAEAVEEAVEETVAEASEEEAAEEKKDEEQEA